jgi:hypothetical protein
VFWLPSGIVSAWAKSVMLRIYLGRQYTYGRVALVPVTVFYHVAGGHAPLYLYISGILSETAVLWRGI